MTHDSFTTHAFTPRVAREPRRVSVRDLAEAGARGRALTPGEIRQVCEALRAQPHTVRNQFHSGM